MNTARDMHQGFFDRLLSACPQLTHVEVSSTASFPLDLFSDAIHRTPRLQSFVLTLPRKRQPAGSMSNFAMRTASRYLSLEELTICEVANWDHADQLSDNYRLLALGVYHVVNATEGGPRYLRVEESGLGRLGRSFNKVTRVIPLS